MKHVHFPTGHLTVPAPVRVSRMMIEIQTKIPRHHKNYGPSHRIYIHSVRQSHARYPDAANKSWWINKSNLRILFVWHLNATHNTYIFADHHSCSGDPFSNTNWSMRKPQHIRAELTYKFESHEGTPRFASRRRPSFPHKEIRCVCGKVCCICCIVTRWWPGPMQCTRELVGLYKVCAVLLFYSSIKFASSLRYRHPQKSWAFFPDKMYTYQFPFHPKTK